MLHVEFLDVSILIKVECSISKPKCEKSSSERPSLESQ